MAKRKKHNRNKSSRLQRKINSQSPEELEQQATQALSTAQYKLAIQFLKSLIKQTGDNPQPSILELLRQAYTGRAVELADQGMIKEAITIWVAAAHHGMDMADPRYINWLMKTQNYTQLWSVYHDISEEAQRDLYPHLAAALLSGETHLLEKLPADNPVLKGYDVAQTLLEAWCTGADSDSLVKQIKAISFRSPYRDLRQVVQAWLLLESSSEKAGEVLQRIPDDSPFQPLAEQVRLLAAPAMEVMTLLPSMSKVEKSVALDLREWTDCTAIIRHIESAQKIKGEKKLYSALSGIYKAVKANHQKDDKLCILAMGLKKTWVNSEVNRHRERFDYSLLENVLGKLPIIEVQHLEGLLAIADQVPSSILINVWQSYLSSLKSSESDVSESDIGLVSALILRYLADDWEKSKGKVTPRSLELREEALETDPSDPESWTTVLEYYLQHRKLKPARDTLKKALDNHPENVALLELGIQIAIAGNAFKKAAVYAKKILTVDPINTRVQGHLQNAHIAHARKVFKQDKLHLVHKELADAQHWKGSELNKNIIAVLQACLSRTEQGAKTSESFKQLAEQSGNPVQLDFIIRHEAHAIGEDSRLLLKEAGLADLWKTRFFKRPQKESLLSLVETVKQFHQMGSKSLPTLLGSLHAPLNKAKKLNFSVQEGEQLCEFWLTMEQHALLLNYAKALEETYPDKPVFIYYRYINTNDYDFWVIETLEEAWHKAREQGDNSLTARLGNLLQRLSNPFAGRYEDDPDDDFPDDLDDIFPSDMEPLDMLSNMADFVQEMPLFALKELAEGIFGKNDVTAILKKFGEQSLRDLCGSALRGEDVQKTLNKLEKQLPLEGF